jgi:hypothetical protein
MKKFFILSTAILITLSVSAKKVKFAVNMSAEIVNTTGIHMYGNFQEAAGYPFNWDPGSTELTQELSDTNVYSIVVDVPAFHVYKYRFINGDQSYEVEFVPNESRVNGTFEDNRWMYVDSTGDDTTFIGVIPYSANAPVGLNLVVFRVNMLGQNISSDSIHVAGTWQGWDPSKCMMINFGDSIYNLHRYQAYLPNGTYHFKFANGNTTADFEYVPGPCGVNSEREVIVAGDTLLDPFNFGSCITGISAKEFASAIRIYPNPSAGNSQIEFADIGTEHSVQVADISGRIIKRYGTTEKVLQLEHMDKGMYTVIIRNASDQEAALKLVVQ